MHEVVIADARARALELRDCTFLNEDVAQVQLADAARFDTLADALEEAAKEPTREHYRERLNSLISALCDERCDAELMDGGWRVRNLDSERLDYILPLLELADGDGNAVATRIGGALLLGLTGRAAIDAAKAQR